jgi:orotate phosphoribosyltransferase
MRVATEPAVRANVAALAAPHEAGGADGVTGAGEGALALAANVAARVACTCAEEPQAPSARMTSNAAADARGAAVDDLTGTGRSVRAAANGPLTCR